MHMPTSGWCPRPTSRSEADGRRADRRRNAWAAGRSPTKQRPAARLGAALPRGSAGCRRRPHGRGARGLCTWFLHRCALTSAPKAADAPLSVGLAADAAVPIANVVRVRGFRLPWPALRRSPAAALTTFATAAAAAARVAIAPSRAARAAVPEATASTAAATAAAAASSSSAATVARGAAAAAPLEEGDQVIDVDGSWHKTSLLAASWPLRRVVALEEGRRRRDAQEGPRVGPPAPLAAVPSGLARTLAAEGATSRQGRRRALQRRGDAGADEGHRAEWVAPA
jgi:hypothetical protein